MNACWKQLPFLVACLSVWEGMVGGCATVRDEIYLQNVDLEGAPSPTPVHITDAGMRKKSFHVSPHVSLGAQKSSTIPLTRQYSEPIPDSLVAFQRAGLQWDLPTVRMGMDLDLAVSDHVALMGGISTAMSRGSQLTSGYGGIGLFTPDTGLSFRLDIGLQFNATVYKAASVLVRTTTLYDGSSSREVIYFSDRGKESHLNFFTNVTLNSSGPGQLIGWFFQIGVSPQTLTSFTPERAVTSSGFGVTHIVSDERAESSVFWLSGVPGIFLNVGESQRVVVGVRLLKDISDAPEMSSGSSFLWIPLVQLDWGL